MKINLSIYFDNSATTQVSKRAAEKAIYMMRECFGNPSSLHAMGFSAEREVKMARESVAESIGAEAREVYFTSGGTESNNIAIFGAANSKKRLGNKILTSSIEHPSVLEAMKELEKNGFQVTYLQPTENGNIAEQDIYNNVTKDTILVSLMSVNNETGAILPLKAVNAAIKRSGSQALFHVDNVQGFGKIMINVKRLGIDILTVSGHKVHAPKGVGALYVNRTARILPRVFGGGQENGLRSGTENVPAIAAMGVAVRELSYDNNKVKKLNELICAGLEQIREVTINSPKDASSYIINFSLGCVRGETMLHFLAEKSIYISTGSACSRTKSSHVLTAMALPKAKIESSVRISLCEDNTEEDVEKFLVALTEGITALAHV